jgi:hypothetical protein
VRDLPDLRFRACDLHGTLANPLQRARQDVDAILEKEYLHAKNARSVEHVFSMLPVILLIIGAGLMQEN